MSTGLSLFQLDRPPGGGLSRFRHVPRLDSNGPTQQEASLAPDHPAVTESRSLFSRSVVDVRSRYEDVLISGVNNSKIGGRVTKGAWAGFPIFTLTLEERKTCPTSCDLWLACYGNAMPLAKRFRYSPMFLEALDESLASRARKYPGGFVVRLHVLGDFPDISYTDRWLAWLVRIPQLHVFGYTHHPADSRIGRALCRINEEFPSRWRVRFSVSPGTLITLLQATTVWRSTTDRRVPDGIVCPVQRGATQTCGTCGLCWARPADAQRIVFFGHGMTKRRKGAVK